MRARCNTRQHGAGKWTQLTCLLPGENTPALCVCLSLCKRIVGTLLTDAWHQTFEHLARVKEVRSAGKHSFPINEGDLQESYSPCGYTRERWSQQLSN